MHSKSHQSTLKGVLHYSVKLAPLIRRLIHHFEQTDLIKTDRIEKITSALFYAQKGKSTSILQSQANGRHIHAHQMIATKM